MDLRQFYQKLRDCEAGIQEAFAVVVSNDTGDGGRSGVRTEVPRTMAARLVAEGRARLASAEEADSYYLEAAEAARTAERLATVGRVQMAVVSESELSALRSALRNRQGE